MSHFPSLSPQQISNSSKVKIMDFLRNKKKIPDKKKQQRKGIKPTGISHQAEIHHCIWHIARRHKEEWKKKKPRKPTPESEHPTTFDDGFCTFQCQMGELGKTD